MTTMTDGYTRVLDIKYYPTSERPPDVEHRLPLIHLPPLNGDSLNLSDKVFEYCCVKLQQSDIFLLKF